MGKSRGLRVLSSRFFVVIAASIVHSAIQEETVSVSAMTVVLPSVLPHDLGAVSSTTVTCHVLARCAIPSHYPSQILEFSTGMDLVSGIAEVPPRRHFYLSTGYDSHVLYFELPAGESMFLNRIHLLKRCVSYSSAVFSFALS